MEFGPSKAAEARKTDEDALMRVDQMEKINTLIGYLKVINDFQKKVIMKPLADDS